MRAVKSRWFLNCPRYWTSAALIVASFGNASVAQQAGKYYPPRSAPVAEMAGFATVAGGWHCKGTLLPGALRPGAPGTDYTSSLTIQPIYEGYSYTVAYELHFPDDPWVFSGTWYVSWDPADRQVSYLWLDNLGNFAREAGGGWQDGRLVLTGQSSLPSSVVASLPADVRAGRPVGQLRDVLTRTGSDKLHWKGEMLLPGSKTPMALADDECVRSWPTP